MLTGHIRVLALIGIVTGSLSGCAQNGPILSRRTTLGTLKSSVSHLEFENEQLHREIVQLKADNRQIEDRLVQEETTNGELSARLDDARYALAKQGIDTGEGEAASTAAGVRQDPGEAPTTLPAGRSSRRRKPPVTQIPGRIENAPGSDEPEDDATLAPRTGKRDEIGDQSSRSNTHHWLPVAKGTSAVTSAVR